MKHLSIISALLLSFTLITAQEKTEKPTIKLYGFVRNELAIDTYKGVESFNDIFYLLPIYAADDANKGMQSYMTTAATRLGTKITGPELFDAKTNAVIEFDFGGITSSYPTLLRIRHAYVNFNWETSSLLIGQTWHPFWGDDNFPHTGSLNTGAPFQAFNRSPMVRYNYKIKDNIQLTAAMVYENQYTSKGFYTVSDDVDKTQPQRLGAIPEFVGGITYRNETTAVGLLAEYKNILPIDENYLGAKTTKLKSSWGTTAYARYKSGKFYFLAKGTYGQDLTHLTMPGGYGVSGIDKNDDYEYTNYNNMALLANAVYGKKWQVGAFVGYGKNFGTSETLLNMSIIPEETETKIAGLFTSVQNMYRTSVHGALNVKNFRFVAEYELTSANYGSGPINLEDGLYNSTVNATNHRTVLMMMYMF